MGRGEKVADKTSDMSAVYLHRWFQHSYYSPSAATAVELIAGDVRVPQKAPRFCAFHYCVGILSVWLCHIFSQGEGGKEGMEKKIRGRGGGGGGGWEEK